MGKKEQKIYIIILAIIAIYFIVNASSIYKIFAIDLFKVLLILILSVLMFVLIKFVSKEKEVHNKFFIVATSIGMILIVIIPVLHGIDEGAHFFKVYSIFNKVETVQDDELGLLYKIPMDIFKADKVNSYFDELNLVNDKSDNRFILSNEYLGINLYSVLAYITYLLPMFIFQKILNLGIVPIILTGRLFSFIIWIIISTYTIKIIPKRKEFMAFLCLMPLNLTLVTAYTGDLVTNSSILLFIAYWYRLYHEKRPIKTSEIIAITILGILSACSKLVYALIFLIMLFLPKECFKNQKHRVLVNLFILIVLVVTLLINLFMVGNDLLEAYPKIEEQKQWIMNNPLKYIGIFFITILTYLDQYLFQFTTGYTTMLQNTIYVNEYISGAYLILLVLSLLIEEADNKFNKKFKILVISIVGAIVFTIFTSLYLQWTATMYSVGCELIQGVQGRYFFPLVALLALISTKGIKNVDNKYLWNGVIIINFIILLKILVTF